MRDALSLLDQAIAHAAGTVRADDVRTMLGLADRTRVIDLFESLMKGDVAAALKELREQYDIGADPLVVLADLAEFTHFVTRIKIVPAVADDISLGEAERTRGRALRRGAVDAGAVARLADAAQGHHRGAGRGPAARRRRDGAGAHRLCGRPADAGRGDPLARRRRQRAPVAGAGAAATATALAGAGERRRKRDVRRCAGVARSVTTRRAALRAAWQSRGCPIGGAVRARHAACAGRTNRAAPCRSTVSPSWCALASDKRDIQAKMALERDVRLVRCEDGTLEIALEPSAAKTLVNDLSRKLQHWTGRSWMVVISREPGAPTLKSVADARKAELETGVRADPLVKAVLERFPGAEIVGVRGGKDAPPEPVAAAADPDEIPLPDDIGFGDNWERRRVSRSAMADFLGMMKQAAQMQSKMQEMQAELDRIEVEGTSGGGMVTVQAQRQGRAQGREDRRLAGEARGKGNPRGPAGRGPRRRAPQGRRR